MFADNAIRPLSLSPIDGKRMYNWYTVRDEGEVLVQRQRDGEAGWSSLGGGA
jgi:hypothetical protein